MRVWTFLLLISPLLFSCKKSSSENKSDPSPIPSPQVMDVSGHWTSQDTPTDPDVIEFVINQSGVNTTGTFNLNSGQAVGTLKGAANESLFKFTLTEPAPCPGNFTGSAVLNKGKLEGNLAGSDCSGAFEGTFQMHKV